MAIEPISDEQLREALAKAQSREEIETITALRLQLNRDRLGQAVRSYIDGTMVYLDLIDQLEDTIKGIGFAPGLEQLLTQASDIHLALQQSGMRSAGDASRTDPVSQPPDGGKPIARPAVAPIVEQPETVTGTSYTDLKDEYVRFFAGQRVKVEHEPRVLWYAQKALKHRSRYDKVAEALAIPWWFVAGVHALESTFNTSAHLHNGDPLTARTTHVPKNRPKTGTPPFTWEESATDALKGQNLHNLSDWSLPRALYRWERYNGFGYRKRKVPSPYLWSFGTVYERGKFTSDGRFSGTAVSQQCGAAVLLRYLHDRGDVEIDFDFGSPPSADSGKRADSAAIAEAGPYGAWWRDTLPHIVFFQPKELLVKGASHASNGLNTDPPERLWPNSVKLVETLEAIRRQVNRPVRLNSAYRSPAYNSAIGGATRSQHKEFKAADITVDGMAPAQVVKAVLQLRERGVFAGGVGRYRSFTHVDVRGHNVFWSG